MAVDAKKMAAFAGKKPQGGGMPGKGKGGGGGGPPESGPASSKEPSEASSGAKSSGAGGDHAQLQGMITQHADDVSQCLDELDKESLHDPTSEMTPEDQQIFREGFESLDFKDALREAAEGITLEEAQGVADAVGDAVEDPDALAGWLVRVGELGDGPASSQPSSSKGPESSGPASSKPDSGPNGGE